MSVEALRMLVREELKQLVTDDALLKTKDLPGLDDFHGEKCPRCAGSGTSKRKQYHKSNGTHSSYMAKPQLDKIVSYADMLFDMISDDEPVPDWMESKISQMSQMIGDVYHSYKYKSHN